MKSRIYEFFGRHSNLRSKLYMITGSSTVIVLFVMFGTIAGLLNSITEYHALLERDVAHERLIVQLELRYNEQEQQWMKLLASTTEVRWQGYQQAANIFLRQVDQMAVNTRARGQGTLTDVAESYRGIMGRRQEAWRLYQTGASQALTSIDSDQAVSIEQQLEGLQSETAKSVGAADAAEYQQAEDTLKFGVIMLVMAVILAFVWFSFVVNRSIVRPARVLAADLKRLSDGDFSRAVEATTQDEIGQIAESAQRLQLQLSDLIRQIITAAKQLSVSADGLMLHSEEAARHLSVQQAETEQVARSISQLSTTIQDVARSAEAAAISTEDADRFSGNGKLVVTEAISSIDRLAVEVEQVASVIHELEREAGEIGTVIDVITGIAEQTNLLALNAAIEAARAGEQGRGFAVVADEVRSLASRTQESTGEIKKIIEKLQTGTVNAVRVMVEGQGLAKQSVDMAEKVGESLATIVGAVATIKGMNTTIASAAEEESAVATEINRNISTISDAVSRNVEGARAVASNSQELAKVATHLEELVGRFKV